MYLKRLVENTIEKKMQYTGAVHIEGPKWCGKSTTAARYAKTVVKLQDPITFNRYQIYATTSKDDLLFGTRPILFDEWQKIPSLWDFIRLDVDDANGQPGQYLLTGSAQPREDVQRHSGAGRIASLKIRTLSLYESLQSTGEVSLALLFEKSDAPIRGESHLTIEQQIKLTCKGGWPALHSLPEDQSASYLKDYFNRLLQVDISEVDGIKRNSLRAKAILRTYARNISTMASYQTMLNDLENIGEGVNKNTLDSYLSALERLYVIEDVLAWTPKLRSSATIRSTPKRQFVDPAIAIIALNATPHDLSQDLETYGFFFESLVTRDLRVYMDSLSGNVFFYRDNTNLEVDCILKLDDGRWAAVEVKLGGNQLDQAAENLLKLKDKIDTDHMSQPSFLMVVYGGIHAYRRPDGVYVVPLGCLRP